MSGAHRPYPCRAGGGDGYGPTAARRPAHIVIAYFLLLMLLTMFVT